MTKESPKPRNDTISRSLYDVKVAFDVTESVHFAQVHGFYDVTGNFELDSRAIG